MGPITLFDKSFLQSLSLDESVWFGHYYKPVVCPLFFVETLADLEKAVGDGRTPEQVVGSIADKFPEMSSDPCTHHATLALGELHGHRVPMISQIPISGGRVVNRDGKMGMVFDTSPEAKAFSRWRHGKFLDLERGMARQWRSDLSSLDLSAVAKSLREIGIDQSVCKSLEDAKLLADTIVSDTTRPFARMQLAVEFLSVPRHYHHDILQRWSSVGYSAITEYAPYTAYVLTIELFFYFALAAHLISTERASNRVDIAYLHYLPFCHMFTSSDRLHRRCAPILLRDDQDFVWGQDLKNDLSEINSHYSEFPESEREKGIMSFAGAPPQTTCSLTKDLRQKFLRPGVDDDPIDPPSKESQKSCKLVDELKKWEDAPTAELSDLPEDDEDIQMMTFERSVANKKGSWWVLPKDIKDESDNVD